MKTLDPHSLINNEVKQIEITDIPLKSFEAWRKKTMKVSGISIFDAFVAGFFLGTNSMLRDKYVKSNKDEKYDYRLS